MPKFQRTPQELQTDVQSLQSLSRAKPRQTAVIIKLAQAQLGIRKALEPFEQARTDLLATLPAAPAPDAPEELKAEHTAASEAVDVKFRKIFTEEKFAVKLPEVLTNLELQQFTDPINPNDLVNLHPHMINLDEVDKPKATKKA